MLERVRGQSSWPKRSIRQGLDSLLGVSLISFPLALLDPDMELELEVPSLLRLLALISTFNLDPGSKLGRVEWMRLAARLAAREAAALVMRL